MPKKIPMRMCVACRTMYPKNTLLRLVKTENHVEIDFTGKKNGRGAYICDNPDCISKCLKGKLLGKVFDSEISDDVYDYLREQYGEYGKNK